MIRVVVSSGKKEGRSTVAAAISAALMQHGLLNIIVDDGDDSAAELLTERPESGAVLRGHRNLAAMRERFTKTGERIAISTKLE